MLLVGILMLLLVSLMLLVGSLVTCW
jgi:hypothetical protein